MQEEPLYNIKVFLLIITKIRSILQISLSASLAVPLAQATEGKQTRQLVAEPVKSGIS